MGRGVRVAHVRPALRAVVDLWLRHVVSPAADQFPAVAHGHDARDTGLLRGRRRVPARCHTSLWHRQSEIVKAQPSQKILARLLDGAPAGAYSYLNAEPQLNLQPGPVRGAPSYARAVRGHPYPIIPTTRQGLCAAHPTIGTARPWGTGIGSQPCRRGQVRARDWAPGRDPRSKPQRLVKTTPAEPAS